MYTDELFVVESVEEANHLALKRVIGALEEAIAERGNAWLVVAGGSTFLAYMPCLVNIEA